MHQKQQWTLLQNPGIIQKLKDWSPGTALLSCSSIRSFPPTPQIAAFILKSNAFCYLLLCLHSQLPPITLLPCCSLLTQMAQLYLPNSHGILEQKASAPSPILNRSFRTEDTGVQRDQANCLANEGLAEPGSPNFQAQGTWVFLHLTPNYFKIKSPSLDLHYSQKPYQNKHNYPLQISKTSHLLKWSLNKNI